MVGNNGGILAGVARLVVVVALLGGLAVFGFTRLPKQQAEAERIRAEIAREERLQELEMQQLQVEQAADAQLATAQTQAELDRIEAESVATIAQIQADIERIEAEKVAAIAQIRAEQKANAMGAEMMANAKVFLLMLLGTMIIVGGVGIIFKEVYSRQAARLSRLAAQPQPQPSTPQPVRYQPVRLVPNSNNGAARHRAKRPRPTSSSQPVITVTPADYRQNGHANGQEHSPTRNRR